MIRTLKARLSAEGTGYVHVARKFKAMDLDGNGTIDFEEFVYGLHEMDMVLSHEKMVKLFRYFDKNGNVLLSLPLSLFFLSVIHSNILSLCICRWRRY